MSSRWLPWRPGNRRFWQRGSSRHSRCSSLPRWRHGSSRPRPASRLARRRSKWLHWRRRSSTCSRQRSGMPPTWRGCSPAQSSLPCWRSSRQQRRQRSGLVALRRRSRLAPPWPCHPATTRASKTLPAAATMLRPPRLCAARLPGCRSAGSQLQPTPVVVLAAPPPARPARHARRGAS